MAITYCPACERGFDTTGDLDGCPVGRNLVSRIICPVFEPEKYHKVFEVAMPSKRQEKE